MKILKTYSILVTLVFIAFLFKSFDQKQYDNLTSYQFSCDKNWIKTLYVTALSETDDNKFQPKKLIVGFSPVTQYLLESNEVNIWKGTGAVLRIQKNNIVFEDGLNPATTCQLVSDSNVRGNSLF